MSLLNELNIKKEEIIVNTVIDYESDIDWLDMEERRKNEMLDLTGYTFWTSTNRSTLWLPKGYTYIILPVAGSAVIYEKSSAEGGPCISTTDAAKIKIVEDNRFYCYFGAIWRKAN